MNTLKALWKNEVFKTLVAILLIVVIFLGFYFGLQIGLNTSSPFVVVESGSMSIPYGAGDNNFGLTLGTPFNRTLSVGDIIILQGVNVSNLNTNYPNSDIIVFYNPNDPSGTPIVHRIIGTEVVNGTTYFLTKGDGNGNPWPQTPQSGLDSWDYNNPPGVPQNLVIGKVVMRIPWFGWITLFIRDTSWGLPVTIMIMILIVAVVFIMPSGEKKPKLNNN